MPAEPTKSPPLTEKRASAQAPSGDAEDNAASEVLQCLDAEAPGISDKLPREQWAKVVRILTSRVVTKHHEGPLPPPEYMASYNQHIPDGANRIMALAEKQADHRMAMERQIVTSQLKQSARGQVFGLLIGIFGIVSGAIVALQGHDVVGGGIAGLTVISLVYAFISGQRSQRGEESNRHSSSEKK